MKYSVAILFSILLTGCGNDFRPKEEQEISLSDTIRERTGDGIYPDTTREEHLEGGPGYTLHIYHNQHLRETQIFYESGSLAVQYFFRNGKDDSLKTTWHENGVMQMQAQFKNGKSHGWIRSWTSDGTLHEESYFEFDSLIKGSRVCLDENFIIDHVEIIEGGKVVRIDTSLKGTEA